MTPGEAAVMKASVGAAASTASSFSSPFSHAPIGGTKPRFSPSMSPASPPLRVMLVDDHEIVRDGIRAMLEGLRRFGWEPINEGTHIIGLKQGGGAISLEPGGQLELSGAPLRSIHETCSEVNTHLGG